ncbi:MAG: 50S ribosomal protein L32 [Candidatus Comchoanobacterales bacterium]
MAVQKSKVTRRRRGLRRLNQRVVPVSVRADSETGEYRVSHHVDSKQGYYKGTIAVKKLDFTQAE